MERAALLIVDDEPLILETMAEFFEAFGFRVTACPEAASSLAAAFRTPFRAAIVDFRLPGISGDELVRQLKILQPRLEVFLHSGALDLDLSPELRNLGIGPDRIFFKPVDLLHMGKTIKAVLGV